MVLETGRLPNIVQGFLKHSNDLQKILEKATLEIVEDIKVMLYDHESKFSYAWACCTHSYPAPVARWLDSDKMSHQSHHHADLWRLQADQACEFLLEITDFINWYYGSDTQQLLIVSDMGCGKSVAMAFLVDKLNWRNGYQLPHPKTCYYYCQDGETGNAISIFSALILSLLDQLWDLKKPSSKWYKQAKSSGIFNPATDINKLEESLQKVLEVIDRPIFIIVDDLDECDTASQNNLLKLLKILLERNSWLKTILSSHSQEETLEQLDKTATARIELGSNTQQDDIIVEKTVELQLSSLSENVKALVIEKLSHLAQECAIWTKMIIELIDTRKIRAFNPMWCFLKEIPLLKQLSRLYVMLFFCCTSNNPENQELASTALKLLAITHRSFSILELAWAVALDAAQHITTINALAKLIDHQRIMSLIHPFIAWVDFSDVKKCQIWLTHQSVKKFIIKEWTSNQPHLQGPALQETDQMILDQHLGSLEAFILDICIRYLLLDDIGNRDLFSDEQVAITELPQEFNLFSDNEELWRSS